MAVVKSRNATVGRKLRSKPSKGVKAAATGQPKKKPAGLKITRADSAARLAAKKVEAAASWSVFLDSGGVDPLKVSRDLGITKADLAETLGLPADALVRDERIAADKTQARLTELLEILNRVEPWSGGLRPAFAWYRSQGIPALGDETAEALVKTNRAGHVRTYLNAIAAGGFA